jgi:hypothetical protein
MLRNIGRAVVVAAVSALGVTAVPTVASAAQVPCGNPTDVRLHLRTGTTICFAGVGRNSFNKIGVVKVETGSYVGSLTAGTRRYTFGPGETRYFQPAINPQFVDLSAFVRP